MPGDRPPHWSREFLQPVSFVTTVFGVLGVIGVVFGFYAYHQTASRPQVSWSSLKQIVFDHRNTTPAITVLDRQGNKIEENVYASQITVWNSGNVRFDNVDDGTLIRQPLTFRLTGTGNIVSAVITNARDDTAGAWSVKAGQQTAVMAWRHFDPGAAARILILHTGNGSSDVVPEIAVAGESVLRNVPVESKPQSLSDMVLMTVMTLFTSFFVPFAAFSHGLRSIVNTCRRLRNDSRILDEHAFLNLAAWMGLLGMVAMAAVLYALVQPSIPTF